MKETLAIVCLLTTPFAITQCVSLRRYHELRAWMTGRASEEILVGAAWPFAENQDGMDEGLLLAQEELNVRGVRGKRIRLLMRDDRLDREESRAMAGDRIGRKLARMCMERGYHNFAVIAEDGAFGEDLAYQTGIELDAWNAHVVYQATYVQGKVDFRETVDELKDVGADVILFLGLEAESAQFIQSARALGLETPIVGSFSDTPEMHAIAGAALEGVMFFDIYDVNSQAQQNRDFVAAYRRRFGKDPQAYAAQGYDALRIPAKAIETTGSTDSLDLAYAIRHMERWEGANGSYKFDPAGELEDKDIFLKVYRRGTPVVLAASHSTNQDSPLAR